MIEQEVIVASKDNLIPQLARALADYLEMPVRVNDGYWVDVSFQVQLTDKAIYYRNLVATCERKDSDIMITLCNKKQIKSDVK